MNHNDSLRKRRLPKAAQLHAVVTALEHGHDAVCRCRIGRKIDEATDEARNATLDEIERRLPLTGEEWLFDIIADMRAGK